MVKKKGTVFVSEGYYNEAVKHVVEKNRWLLEMEYVDLNPEEGIPKCWNGSPYPLQKGNLIASITYSSNKILHLYIEGDNQHIFIANCKIKDSTDFNDVTKPTEQEKDYFEMIYGVRIPWSEDQPLVIDED